MKNSKLLTLTMVTTLLLMEPLLVSAWEWPSKGDMSDLITKAVKSAVEEHVQGKIEWAVEQVGDRIAEKVQNLQAEEEKLTNMLVNETTNRKQSVTELKKELKDIEGRISTQTGLVISNQESISSLMTALQASPLSPCCDGEIINNPTVPFTYVIPGKLQPNKIVSITGKPLPTAKRFTINMASGPTGRPEDDLEDGIDVALHFDVRFNMSDHVNVVVINSFIEGAWGAEEKGMPHSPFVRNEAFEMTILAELDSFKVEINNQHFIDFVYRLEPLTRITHIGVTGDVQLSQVRFN